ncbi:MAG TPA: DUF3105 domain-containing protein [Candidatus Limnocylindria bacterium]|nr:DUF3105 domain-containing protein [Candidatus Limnocylindria bacterium]
MSSTLTRRERREQQRRQRGRRPQTPSPKRGGRRISGLWIGLGVVVLGIGVVFAAQALGVIKAGPAGVNLNDPKFSSAEVIGTKFPDEGNSHVNPGQKVGHNQNPPTSGSHWPGPQAPASWGIKDTQLPNEVIVHNLEHGGVVIFYRGLTPEETEKLKDIVRLLANTGYKKVILEPYADMSDARIALSAWDWGLKLAAYDDVKVVQFVKQHYQGPDAPEATIP